MIHPLYSGCFLQISTDNESSLKKRGLKLGGSGGLPPVKKPPEAATNWVGGAGFCRRQKGAHSPPKIALDFCGFFLP